MIALELIPKLVDDANALRAEIRRIERIADMDINLYHDIVSDNEIYHNNYVANLVYVEQSELEI